MKFNYHSFGIIYFFFLVFLVFFCIVFFVSIRVKFLSKYVLVSGVVIQENEVAVLVNSKELSWLYRNHWVLFDGDKVNFQLQEVKKKIIRKRDTWYHQVILVIRLNQYRLDETVILGICQKKCSFSSLFFDIWKGG